MASNRPTQHKAPAKRGLFAPLLMALCLAGCTTPYESLIPPVGRIPGPSAPVTDLSYVVLIPSPDGSVGKVTVQGDKGAPTLEKSGQAATLDGQLLKDPVGEEKVRRDFGAAIDARPPMPEHYTLYFVEGVKLTPESATLLAKIVETAKSRPVPDVTLDGYTDTVDSAEFNEQLSRQRAEAVAEQLRAGGLKLNTVAVTSHGERDLLVQTPDKTFEPKNRRVEVSIR